MQNNLHIIGFASGIGGNNADCALGPWYLYYHPEWFQHLPMTVIWEDFIKASSHTSGVDVLPQVIDASQALSQSVLNLVQTQQKFAVIGGDHSCAIGTWSAVAHANRSQGDMGLLWFDAHMDSHTPSSSLSQNLHGMPLAALLGHGTPALCQLLDEQPKLKAQNVCLIGIRSYEAPERLLLEQLGVRVYYMEEIQERGLSTVVNEAYDTVSAHTCGIGISIDMDAIDPQEAPGVGCREEGGLSGQALREALQHLPKCAPLLGVEIAEYNPILDTDSKTARLLIELLASVLE